MCELLIRTVGYERVSAMRPPSEMALFGMVWLLRVRAEMKRCAKCRRQDLTQNDERTSSVTTFFTIDAPAPLSAAETAASANVLTPTTYCEVHGYNPRKEGKIEMSLGIRGRAGLQDSNLVF